MILSKAKIKADWRLTVMNASGHPIRLYQFPDTILDSLLNDFSNDAIRPLGDGDVYVKWGTSNAPINVSQTQLVAKTNPTKYTQWPKLAYGVLGRHDGNLGHICPSLGLTEFYISAQESSVVVIKRSGNYDPNDTSVDGLGNPTQGSWITLYPDDLPNGISEIGTFRKVHSLTRGTSADDLGTMRNSPVVSTRALVLDRYGLHTTITLSSGESLRVERIEQVTFVIPPPVDSVLTVVNARQSDTGITHNRTREHGATVVAVGSDHTPIGGNSAAWYYLAPHEISDVSRYYIECEDYYGSVFDFYDDTGTHIQKLPLRFDGLSKSWVVDGAILPKGLLVTRPDSESHLSISRVKLYLLNQVHNGGASNAV
jgi:hypothetical protein